MNPVAKIVLLVLCAGAITAAFLLLLWVAMRRPQTKHRKRSKREPYVPAYGAHEDWHPKQEFPAPRPLDAHLDVYQRLAIAEERSEMAMYDLMDAREAVARFEMERDARALREVETAVIQKIRWAGYDPKEATQEISWSPEMAGRR